MQVNIDQLLEFSAYYQINKYASQLTIQTLPIQNPTADNTVNQGKARKKIEIVVPNKKVQKVQKVQKVVKPKFEVVARKDKKIQPVKQKSNDEQQDINFFMSHITSQMMHSKFPKGNKQQPYRQLATKSYQSFGKSDQLFKFVTLQSKMQRQNNNYSRDYMAFKDRPMEFNNYSSKSSAQSPQRMYAQPYQGSKTKQFWEKSVYQTRRNHQNDFGNLMYSPVRRENLSPSRISIISELRSDLSQKKSKSKQKKKNSQRPLYNISQLTVKEKQSQMRAKRHMFEQSVLSHSFISNEELRLTNNKKNEEQGRQTSSTNIRKDKVSYRKEDESELDDGMQEIISQLATEQRNAPIAISLIPKNANK